MGKPCKPISSCTLSGCHWVFKEFEILPLEWWQQQIRIFVNKGKKHCFDGLWSSDNIQTYRTNLKPIKVIIYGWQDLIRICLSGRRILPIRFRFNKRADPPNSAVDWIGSTPSSRRRNLWWSFSFRELESRDIPTAIHWLLDIYEFLALFIWGS